MSSPESGISDPEKDATLLSLSFSKHISEEMSFLDCSSEAPFSLRLLQSDVFKIFLYFQPLACFSPNLSPPTPLVLY